MAQLHRISTEKETNMIVCEDATIRKTNDTLKRMLLKRITKPGKYSTAIDGFFLSRRESDEYVENCFYRPSIGIVVQGRKKSIIGSNEYIYGENQCLIIGIDMPSSFFVSGAKPDSPFLAVSLNLDAHIIARLASELPPVPDVRGETHKGAAVAPVTFDILNAFLRLTSLLDSPEEIAFLAPGIIHELHFRFLVGPLGNALRNIHTTGTHGNQISRAVTWLRDNYKEPLHVSELARRVNMGTSTFHKYFKEVTSLTPLQYHKRLRLYEAQRLMLMEDADAASAGLAVGYESPSQFNREYKRMFGAPPRRDVLRRR